MAELGLGGTAVVAEVGVGSLWPSDLSDRTRSMPPEDPRFHPDSRPCHRNHHDPHGRHILPYNHLVPYTLHNYPDTFDVGGVALPREGWGLSQANPAAVPLPSPL